MVMYVITTVPQVPLIPLCVGYPAGLAGLPQSPAAPLHDNLDFCENMTIQCKTSLRHHTALLKFEAPVT